MLKYIKQHLSSIDGVETYPLISFLIFFGFFILLSVYVVSMRKAHVREISRIPLEDGSKQDINDVQP